MSDQVVGNSTGAGGERAKNRKARDGQAKDRSKSGHTSGQRSWLQAAVYALTRIAVRVVGVLFFRLRVWGRQHFPAGGGALICSNHQSNFDPVLVGLCCQRQMNYLARRTLFKFAPFRWLIEFYDAIPIDREGSGLGGLKESLRRLRRGEMVLIFPEGTRTRDGQVAPLQPGFCALARRSKVPLVPVAIEGAYAAWPRNQSLPQLNTIHIAVGPPITADETARYTDEELVAELERRIRDCFAKARGNAGCGMRNAE